MQTILGANGPIGHELALELHRRFAVNLRLVSRHPRAINEGDELFAADLLDPLAAEEAVKGSEVVYYTAGLPMNTELLLAQWPVMTKNVIAACEKYHAKLVFFDNTYMYPMTDGPQDETTVFGARGAKSVMREKLTQLLLQEMEQERIEAVICRAPEFYGPGKTLSFTNLFIFKPAKTQGVLTIPLSENTKRTLIWTPDASRAMALLGNTLEAYGQTWHLPCDDERMTYAEMIKYMESLTGEKYTYHIKSQEEFEEESATTPLGSEILELLPRYAENNLFLSDKFKKAFPDFQWTSYKQGIREIMMEEDDADSAVSW